MGAIFGVSLVVMVIVGLVIANKFNEIAEMKGHSGYYSAWCFFLGLAGWLMVVALPDRGQESTVHTVQNTMQSSAQPANTHATTPKPVDENLPEL